MSKIPSKAKYVIIGAGIHGLSTAWNLGEKIKAKGQTVKENDIVVGIPAKKYGKNICPACRVEGWNITVATDTSTMVVHNSEPTSCIYRCMNGMSVMFGCIGILFLSSWSSGIRI